MMINNEKPPLDELAHFGIKGMRWGRRKRNNRNQNSDRRQSVEIPNRVTRMRDATTRAGGSAKRAITSAKAKKTAVVLGSALAAAIIAAGTAYAIKQMRGSIGDLKVSDLPSTNSGQNFIKNMTTAEPTGIIYATRSKHKGFQFRSKGGLTDPFAEWSKNDDGQSAAPLFRRYGDRGEKVFGQFPDPLGRTDRAGRIIPHTVILPENLAKDVHNAEDLFNTAWPLIKDDFDDFYEA